MERVEKLRGQGILAKEHPLYEIEWLRRAFQLRTAVSSVLLAIAALTTFLFAYVPLLVVLSVAFTPVTGPVQWWLAAVPVGALVVPVWLELGWLRSLAADVDYLADLEERVPDDEIRSMRLERGRGFGLLRASREPTRDLLRPARDASLPSSSLLSRPDR